MDRISGGNLQSDSTLPLTAPRESRLDSFASAIRRELAPRTLLEQVLVERMILSAWTLQVLAGEEYVESWNRSLRGGAGAEESSLAGSRLRRHRRARIAPRRIFRILQCLEKAIDLFHRLRADDLFPGGRPLLRKGEAPAPAPAPTRGYQDVPDEVDFDPESETHFDLDLDFDSNELADLSNEWPIIPDLEPSGAMEKTDERLAECWQNRLVFEPSVSEDSPVVKGTWVTVSQVVSLVVDGWTWSDILRTHPELTEDDIRVCLAYSVAEDNGEV
jgi:uncharacterized protein (DUF433 family)